MGNAQKQDLRFTPRVGSGGGGLPGFDGVDLIVDLTTEINDLTAADGAIVGVHENMYIYQLDKESVLTPDGVTIVATMSGTGNWIRYRPFDLTDVKVAAYNAQFDEIVRADPSTGSFAVTLPTAAESRGRFVTICNVSESVDGIDVTPNGSDTIDGSTTPYTLNSPHQAVTLVSNGVDGWITTATGSPSAITQGMVIGLIQGTYM